MKKTAVVLLNLGGPSSQEEVKPFLLSLFYDPAIITLPNPFRYILARLIARKRLKEAQQIYAQLGGGSPLFENTKAQAASLEEELGKGYRVFIAMRHAAPLTEAAYAQVRSYEPDEIILLPLYPQYSTTTTESALKAWIRVAKDLKTPTRAIFSYPLEEGFLRALKECTLPHYERAQAQGIPKILLTAHGLPEKIIKKGDPYQSQVEETARAFIKKCGLPQEDFTLCYQSRVGPLKWIGPATEGEIIKASLEKRPLVVIPISFVSEHAETLVELDITYRTLALEKGCPSYHRVETVQTHPSFMKGLANLVKGDTLPLYMP